MAQGLDEGGDVVGVARHHLDEAVVAWDQRLVVDAAGVGLAEAELAALGEKAHRPVELLVERGLVLVARRRAIDDDRRALERLFGLVVDLMTEVLEILSPGIVDRELGAARHQVPDTGAVGLERRALVEGHLVDAHVVLEVGEQPDQRLADGPGPDDVYYGAHFSSSLQEEPLPCSPWRPPPRQSGSRRAKSSTSRWTSIRVRLSAGSQASFSHS